MARLDPFHRRDWVSLREYAALMRISYPTAIKRAKTGKIEGATLVGGVWRIYKEDIPDFKQKVKNL